MKIIRNTDVIQLQHGEFCYNGRKQRDFTGEKVFWRDADKMWKSIRWYKGLYEINENAAVRNVIMISFCICVSFWNSFKMISADGRKLWIHEKGFCCGSPVYRCYRQKKLKSHKHGRQDFPVVFVRRRLMEDILPGKKNPPAGEPPI